MLSKLIRHEFRATGRLMLPVYLLLLGTAGLFNLSIHLASRYDIPALRVFLTLSGIVFTITLVGAGVLTTLLMVYRFYKNYMTDEGYLMFTLPATTSQLLWSKLLVSMVWTVVTLLAIGLSAVVASVGHGFWSELIRNWGEIWRVIFSDVPPGQFALYGLELAVSSLVGALFSYLMFYAAIAVGHSFDNHKILLSVILYIGFYIGLQTITSGLSTFGIAAFADALEMTGPSDFGKLFHFFVLSGIGLSLVAGTAFYLITHSSLKKRLNLQ